MLHKEVVAAEAYFYPLRSNDHRHTITEKAIKSLCLGTKEPCLRHFLMILAVCRQFLFGYSMGFKNVLNWRPTFHCIKIHLDGPTWNEKKKCHYNLLLCMHKKVNWYMNKTIFLPVWFLKCGLWLWTSHLTISNDSSQYGQSQSEKK